MAKHTTSFIGFKCLICLSELYFNPLEIGKPPRGIALTFRMKNFISCDSEAKLIEQHELITQYSGVDVLKALNKTVTRKEYLSVLHDLAIRAKVEVIRTYREAQNRAELAPSETLEERGLAKLCTCGNCGIILDDNHHTQIYLDNLDTVAIYKFVFGKKPNYLGKYEIWYKELVGSLRGAVHIDYNEITKGDAYYKQRNAREYTSCTSPESVSYRDKLIKALLRNKKTYANKGTVLKGIVK